MLNPPDLESVLEVFRRTASPGAPANLKQNVWREIRRREASPSPHVGFDSFLNWFGAGGISLAGSTLALAIFASATLTVMSNPANHLQQVRQSLGLNVFSHHAYPLIRLTDNS